MNYLSYSAPCPLAHICNAERIRGRNYTEQGVCLLQEALFGNKLLGSNANNHR